jgi:hypothetical protein
LAVIFAGQMRVLILGLLITSLNSCGELDNFDVVTKIIEAPDTVTINKAFDFRLILRNDTGKQIKLTIDKDVLKSIQFLPDWRCDDEYVVDRVPNPKSVDNNFTVHYLKPNESLTYNLQGHLSTYSSDSLKFTIAGYDRAFRLRKQECKRFTMTLGGMWLPGDFNPLDAMEDYNFGQQIEIRE